MNYLFVCYTENTSLFNDLKSILREQQEKIKLVHIKKTLELQDFVLRENPDLLFVYINENSNSVFQTLAQCSNMLGTLPKTIGLSSSKDFAYPSIKMGFLDYWLHPFNKLETKGTLKRFFKNQSAHIPDKICLKTYKDYHFLEMNSILYLKADNNATDFFLTDGRVVSAFKTLKYFESKLPSHFFRVQQSFIVNQNYVTRVNFGRQFCLLKGVDEKIPFTKTYKLNIEGLNSALVQQSAAVL